MTTATEHQEEDWNFVEAAPGIRQEIQASVDHGGAPYLDITRCKDGEWVSYDDHLRAVLNPMGHKLSRDMDSLYSVLQFILDNIADLEQSPEFAGFQAHRILNDEGDLLQITLTPCDKIDDITAPRMVNAEAPKVKAVKKPGLKLVDAKGGAL